ncbi:phosphonatase-like hydrolase [Streptomyces sp. ISL-66]|uniref:phosphonatase-like hydrolase n=1 Tax=Streptomyces sp. ISL-66 TaxID=2819186 RepID=UPI001BEBE53C|nr:phosphonatase-like hydrolase [Streptomyces sp. ISL-66]MBT2472520.1 phosphonatase-like hydrolase [Streptomyces sp. ISL-66]
MTDKTPHTSATSTPITPVTPGKLVVLDMAGTTVADGGLVERAFARAAERLGVEPGSADHAVKLQYVRDTMGESKIAVFRHLFGTEELAQRANSAFEEAYGELVDGGLIAPVPGAREAIEELRAEGRTVVLTTGFARVTQDAILDALGWQGLADLTLCPADAGGRGRPYPDMVLAAFLRTGAVADVRETVVAGDTAYDMLSGVRSGAGIVAGVLTGAHDREALHTHGATHVLGSIAELPALLDQQEQHEQRGEREQHEQEPRA